jgi:nucleotide-binding universal stress UspA family protein
MFQRMLIPLDGSVRAERALPVAARLARASHGTLLLLRAATPPTQFALSSEAATALALQQAAEAECEEAQDYLQGVTRLQSLIHIPLETHVIKSPVAVAILSAIEERHIDLIVLCSHGYTGMKRYVLGSVAEKVSHHACVPVLLLHEDGPALVEIPPHAEGSVHALIPLDGSELAKLAIAPAAQLMAALAAPGPGTLHLTLATVLPVDRRIGPHEREDIVRQTQQYLRRTAEQVHAWLAPTIPADLKLSVTWSLTTDGDIAAGIIRMAEADQGSELIAITTHGYSGLQRWALGSVTDRVLHATKLPLLIVRPTNEVGIA